MNLNLLQRHTVEIYDLEYKEYEVQDVPARSLLVGQRFDLFAKLYYIKYRQTNREQALMVYNNHIKAFNPDLKEPGRDDKNGYDDFVNTFDALIDDLNENGFDPDKSIVPVDENGVLLDGAHRVCALAYSDKMVRIARFKGVQSKARFDYEYFMKRGLSWAVADITAHEMVQWLPNMLIACLWPRMGGANVKQDTLAVIARHYPICYSKTINTNLESFKRLIAKVYDGQPWVTSPTAVQFKSLECFGANKQIAFALIEADDIDAVIAFKEEIRQRFQSDKHSIHITDNVDETKEIAKVVFDADELNKWNSLSNSFINSVRETLNERVFYFKNVTLINWKVAVARLLMKTK